MNRSLILVLSFFLTAVLSVEGATAVPDQPTVKKERNHIRAGNKHYDAGRYNEASVEYLKALEANPSSDLARFNLASAWFRQAGASKDQQLLQKADSLFQLVAGNKQCPLHLRGKAYYDRGNLAYLSEQYGPAVELYKSALRCNPDDDEARYNLRMAQLKLKNQQQKGGGGGGNDQEQKQDQKDKNQKQNKNKQDQDKQDQDQGQNDREDRQQNQDKDESSQNQQSRQRQGMSQQNMQQILKTMQDQENSTQQKMVRVKAEKERAERRRTGHKW